MFNKDINLKWLIVRLLKNKCLIICNGFIGDRKELSSLSCPCFLLVCWMLGKVGVIDKGMTCTLGCEGAEFGFVLLETIVDTG